MSVPVDLTFRYLTARPDLEAGIITQVAQLERSFDRIVDRRVLVERSHRRSEAGNGLHVVIDLTVPQGRLVISYDADADALHGPFDEAGRQLQDYEHRHRDAACSG